jgi:hypothetical protein
MPEADMALSIRNSKARIQGSNEDLATCPSYAFKGFWNLFEFSCCCQLEMLNKFACIFLPHCKPGKSNLLRGKADYRQTFQNGLMPSQAGFATAQLVDL